MLRTRCCFVTLWITVSVFLFAHDLQWLQSKFERKSYGEILEPLIDYRMALGDEKSQRVDEADFMLATTLCSSKKHKAEGCNYAALLEPQVWSGSKGQTLTTMVASCCAAAKLPPPCIPGIEGKADGPCANLEAKADGPLSTLSKRKILKQVKK